MQSIRTLQTRMAVSLVCGAVALVGCTTTTITPELVTKPTAVYDAVVIGDMKIQGAAWQQLLPHFRQGLVKELNLSKAFKKVIENATEPRAQSSITISGRITEIDRGSAALRFLIGFGAGSTLSKGKFEIRDSSGAVLVRFEASETYAGGAGIGGWDMVRMEELLEKLGVATAKSVIRWSRGGSLSPPSDR